MSHTASDAACERSVPVRGDGAPAVTPCSPIVPISDTVVLILRTGLPAVPLDPAAVLFGSTRRRVLGWLLGHSDEAFYLRELARHAGAPVGAVQRELEQRNNRRVGCAGCARKASLLSGQPCCGDFPELYGLFVKTVFAAAESDGKSAKSGDVPGPRASSRPRAGASGARKRKARGGPGHAGDCLPPANADGLPRQDFADELPAAVRQTVTTGWPARSWMPRST